MSQSKVKRLNFKERRSALMVAETIIDGFKADPSGMIAMSTTCVCPRKLSNFPRSGSGIPLEFTSSYAVMDHQGHARLTGAPGR